ncbi:hypothetical protein GIB67_039207 [Kingdonia uniflora]|uniref:Uncharacterized protein n=1 Tax=Kingdonia uniflora TaxID=39325 RepID=A0A7J7MLV1_9MAGN|nr:hypothetical protein GIB67_039207 [Kingdonia uniflora]
MEEREVVLVRPCLVDNKISPIRFFLNSKLISHSEFGNHQKVMEIGDIYCNSVAKHISVLHQRALAGSRNDVERVPSFVAGLSFPYYGISWVSCESYD